MTEIAKKEELAQARATASQIRQGIHHYLSTLTLIAKANRERHWKILGYDSWQSYVDGEFGAERLRLPAEHRAKAVQELRLAGLSTPAIASAVGISRNTVAKDLAQTEQPDEIVGIDGKSYPSSRPSQPAPPPVEARAGLTEAETAERSPVEAGDRAGVLPGTPAPQTAADEGDGDTASADASGEEEFEPFASVRAGAAPAPSRGGEGAGVNPSPVEEILANDPAVQAADYLAAFTSALSRAGGFMSFDAERVAQLAGSSTWDAIEAHASVVAHWFASAQKARRGLRVVKGGAA